MAIGSVLGLGNDIIEIDRIRQSLQTHRERFLEKLFTEKEQTYCLNFEDAAPAFAGRFAAKEALAKALGCGFGKDLAWLDLEILNSPSGQPTVICSTLLNSRFKHPKFLLSISHSKQYATAVALWLS